MHQSTHIMDSLKQANDQGKPLQFAVSFDSAENVWTYSRPAVYVSIS